MFHYLSAFAFKTRVCSWRVLSGQLDNPVVAFPSPLFDQLQTRRLNLLPILLQRRKGRREDLGLPDPRDCVLTLVMNMQALQPVVSRIRQPFVLQLMPTIVRIVKRSTILMLLIPTLMTVSLKTALWLQQSVRLILWNVFKTFRQCDQYCQSSVKVSADKSP